MVTAQDLKESFEAMRALAVAFQMTHDRAVAVRLSSAVMDFCRLSDVAVKEAMAVARDEGLM